MCWSGIDLGNWDNTMTSVVFIVIFQYHYIISSLLPVVQETFYSSSPSSYGLLFADVFIPNFRFCSDELGHQIFAFHQI